MTVQRNRNRLKGIFVQKKSFFDQIYGSEERACIHDMIDIVGLALEPEELAICGASFNEVDFLFTGWGAPKIEHVLASVPNLKVIFFAGGTANHFLHPDIWERGIQLTSSYVANAVPVAEYSLASIILGLKQGWRTIMEVKVAHHYRRPEVTTGAYKSTVGIISCGAIGRELLRLLKSFDLQVLIYDPFLSPGEIEDLGGKGAAMDQIFALSDVVSLHTPELKETRGMITAEHFRLMKPGATFLNTARGSIVRENELCEVAAVRPDLQFVLDVLHTEPPVNSSPLFSLPNVIVTPHIAGAMGSECRRMGRYMVEELERYLSGQPMKWVITPNLASRSIHRPEFMAPQMAATV